MSVEEIRKLANTETFNASYTTGYCCVDETKIVKEILLDHAAMVERCHDAIEQRESMPEMTSSINHTISLLKYIIHGDAGKDVSNA